MQAHQNPFEGMTLQRNYEALLNGEAGPKWPNEDIQKGYVGTNKIDLLRRTYKVIEILEQDGAFQPGWKALDYGCGWGRFASTLLSKGRPDQLDLCDAWARSIAIVSSLGFKNKITKVSSLLEPGELPANAYDFVLAFSVFTHLSRKAFDHNIPALMQSLVIGGRLFLTVRHEEFIDHKYKDRSAELKKALKKNGFVFVDSGGDMYGEKLFGDTIISPEFLANYGSARYLGQPHSLQHMYAISRR